MSQPRPELRIGDRERDLAASVLQDAVAEGRITLDELDERLDAVLRAHTYADLDVLVTGLPVEPPSSALTGRRPGVERGWRRHRGPSPGDRLVLDAGWSSVTRNRRWDIPPFLQLNGAVGAVKLDRLQATPLAETVDVQVNGGMGNIAILVPDSWAADTDRLTSAWGKAASRSRPSRRRERRCCCAGRSAGAGSPSAIPTASSAGG